MFASHRKHFLALAALFALALGFAITHATAQDHESVKFTLVNGTKSVIDQFYASPPQVDDWEADILGQDVLNPGEKVDITINDGRADCEYDFKAVFKGDEAPLIHKAVHICNGETYTYVEGN